MVCQHSLDWPFHVKISFYRPLSIPPTPGEQSEPKAMSTQSGPSVIRLEAHFACPLLSFQSYGEKHECSDKT